MGKWIYMALGISFLNGHPPDLEKVHLLAEKIIAEVVLAVTPDSPPLEPASWTENEEHALGRYLETPSLGEVYPGIGKALSRLSRERS